MADETEHILGIVNGFLRPRYRARLRLKPGELIEALHHDLPSKLDPRYAFVVTDISNRTAVLLGIVRELSASRRAFVLCGWAESPKGYMPLEEAVEAVLTLSAAAASIELGEVTLYKEEYHGPANTYLLVKNPGKRETLRRSLAGLRGRRRR